MPRLIALIAPTAVSTELLEACAEIVNGIEPGSTCHIELLDGEDPKTVKRALKQADQTCRVFRARNDGAGVLRVRRYTQEELDASASRPRARRKTRTKAASKPGK